MTATLLEILMIISLGILGGTGAGLLIGCIARRQEDSWSDMTRKDRITNLLLIAACSATLMAVLAWYLFWYTAA